MSSVKSGGYSFRKGKNKGSAPVLRSIEVARSANGGFTARHNFNNSGPTYVEPQEHVFGAKDGAKFMAHISEHMGAKAK